MAQASKAAAGCRQCPQCWPIAHRAMKFKINESYIVAKENSTDRGGYRALIEELCERISASRRCALEEAVAVHWRIVVHTGNRKVRELEENQEARTALCQSLRAMQFIYSISLMLGQAH